MGEEDGNVNCRLHRAQALMMHRRQRAGCREPDRIVSRSTHTQLWAQRTESWHMQADERINIWPYGETIQLLRPCGAGVPAGEPASGRGQAGQPARVTPARRAPHMAGDSNGRRGASELTTRPCSWPPLPGAARKSIQVCNGLAGLSMSSWSRIGARSETTPSRCCIPYYSVVCSILYLLQYLQFICWTIHHRLCYAGHYYCTEVIWFSILDNKTRHKNPLAGSKGHFIFSKGVDVGIWSCLAYILVAQKNLEIGIIGTSKASRRIISFIVQTKYRYLNHFIFFFPS